VPVTSIYTRHDGVVNWKTCIGPERGDVEHIEVFASHVGLVMNPTVLMIVADRASQKPGEWKPFDRAAYPRFLFPDRLTKAPIEDRRSGVNM
jgi:hypothetical protein